MKKIILAFALSILTTVACHAQLTHTSQFVKVVLPKAFSKLSNQQIDSIKNIKSSLTGSSKTYARYLYKAGYIQLGLNDVNGDSVNNNLLATKKFMDDTYSALKELNNSTYKSTIQNTNNNNHTLIISYTIKKVSQYKFYCQDGSNKLMLSGKIECPAADNVKASAFLTEILNNIQFTK